MKKRTRRGAPRKRVKAKLESKRAKRERAKREAKSDGNLGFLYKQRITLAQQRWEKLNTCPEKDKVK